MVSVSVQSGRRPPSVSQLRLRSIVRHRTDRLSDRPATTNITLRGWSRRNVSINAPNKSCIPRSTCTPNLALIKRPIFFAHWIVLIYFPSSADHDWRSERADRAFDGGTKKKKKKRADWRTKRDWATGESRITRNVDDRKSFIHFPKNKKTIGKLFLFG